MRLVYFLLCFLWGGMAAASPFQVTPMRLELESGSNIGSVTVFNSGDKPLDVQVKAQTWSQDSQTGVDMLEPTKELIFFPKIFKVPAHGSKDVRVGYQGDVEGHERSYRLFVRELPVKKPGLSGAQFVLQISMPVFIYPKGAQKPRTPDMQGIQVHDGKLMLKAVNKSPRYYSLNKIELQGKKDGKQVFRDEKAGWYVLSGSQRLFPLGITKSQCLNIDTVQLTGHVLLAQSKEGDVSQAALPVTPELCNRIQSKK